MPRGSFVQGTQIGTAEASLYQTPLALDRVEIQKAEFINTGTTPVTLQVWITPDGSTSTADNFKVISGRSIGVNETYIAGELIGEYVNSQGHIYALGSATGVSAYINGNTYTTGA